MTKNQFIADVKSAVKRKPENWRDGQMAYNYLDMHHHYAVLEAKYNGFDCFNDDSQMDAFIEEVYRIMHAKNVHEFPGDNMIEE